MEAPEIQKPIFEFLDFREFLRARYQEIHATRRNFSYRYIGDKIGLDSGSVSRVLNGDRKLDLEKLSTLCKVFGLSKVEQEYFETLVLYGQAKSNAEKNFFLEKVFRLRNFKAKTLDGKQYEFYKEWYYLAIWTLLNFYPYDGDIARLSKMLRPAIRPAEAKKALQLLKEIGLLTEKDGKWSVTEKVLTSGETIQAIFLNNLHLSMGELATRSLQAIPAKERDFSGTMLTLSAEGFDKIISKIKVFRKEVMDIARQEENANCAYRLNLQLFPLSRIYQLG